MAEGLERFVGVDVGTGSARAALVTATGKVEKLAVHDIQTWNPEQGYYEQSSEDIWKAVCKVVKAVIEGVNKELILGIGFDATCSLVIFGEGGKPLTVSKTGKVEQNIILWMDHRAQEQADQINATKHQLLNFVGGQVSLEMELPKLLWLKENLSDSYNKMQLAFDLPDFLTWRATGTNSRSLCSLVCKWNYDSAGKRWDPEFLHKAGLKELAADQEKIGTVVKAPGEPVGTGLSEVSAKELGLKPGTAVGTSLIDAHAGALGMLGTSTNNEALQSCSCSGSGIDAKMALIAGTSTCHMSLTQNPCATKGVWGPYQDAILQCYYLNEGGQSATGILLDYVVQSHPAYSTLKQTHGDMVKIYQYLNDLIVKMASDRNYDEPALLTKDYHVWPDYHGNRSPLADSNLQGMISGLNMGRDDESLAITYLAFMQSLAYGTRSIIEAQMKSGRSPYEVMLFAGGLAKNPLYVQCHADICNLDCLVPNEAEMVLVGSAAMGAYASGFYSSLEMAAKAMGGLGKKVRPNAHTIRYHNKKYKVFLEMVQDQYKYRKLMTPK